MAIDFQVTGPCDVWVSGATSTLAKLGRTNNDNLPAIDWLTHVKTETDVAQGASPACTIINNQEAVLTAALVTYDLTVLAALRARLNGNTGPIATVGASVFSSTYSGGAYCIVEFRPILTGKNGIKFFCCFADGNAFKESQFGNLPKVLALNLRAVPNPVDNVLYELTTT